MVTFLTVNTDSTSTFLVFSPLHPRMSSPSFPHHHKHTSLYYLPLSSFFLHLFWWPLFSSPTTCYPIMSSVSLHSILSSPLPSSCNSHTFTCNSSLSITSTLFIHHHPKTVLLHFELIITFSRFTTTFLPHTNTTHKPNIVPHPYE